MENDKIAKINEIKALPGRADTSRVNAAEKTAGKKYKTPKSSGRSKDRVSLKARTEDKFIRENKLTGKKFQKPGAPEPPSPAGKTAAAPEKKKKWTVLVYMAGDNNLEEYMAEEVLEMEKVGSSKDMNIVAQIDRGENATVEQHGGKPGVVRYYIEKSKRPDKITSTELKDMGQMNSAQFRYLRNFLTWGMKNYPAERYFIIADSHGAGQMGLITDDTGGKPEIASIPEFRSAIQMAEKDTGVEKDQVLLGMNNCLMGQTEFVYELKDTAAMMVASQSTIDTASWRMDDILGREGIADFDIPQMAEHVFNTNNSDRVDPRKFNLNTHLVNKFSPQGVTRPRISTAVLVDLKQAGKLKKAVTALEAAVLKSPEEPAKIKHILEIDSRPGFFSNTSISHYASDFYASAQKLAQDKEIKDPELKKAARSLMKTLDQVMVDHSHRNTLQHSRNANGLGVLTTGNAEMFININYQNLAFNRDTGWGQFISTYGKDLTLDEMDAALPDTAVKHPQFKEISQISKDALKNFSSLKGEIQILNSDLEKLAKNPKLSERDRFMKSAERISKLSPLSKIHRANQRILSNHQKEIVNTLWENLILTAASAPDFLPDLLKGGMALLSGMDEGEISTKTLAKGARQYLFEGSQLRRTEAVKSDLKAAFSEYHRLNAQYPKPDLTPIMDKITALQTEGVRRATYDAFGAESLLVLGYATRNPRVVNLKNYTGIADLEFIQRMARMRPKKVQA